MHADGIVGRIEYLPVVLLALAQGLFRLLPPAALLDLQPGLLALVFHVSGPFSTSHSMGSLAGIVVPSRACTPHAMSSEQKPERLLADPARQGDVAASTGCGRVFTGSPFPGSADFALIGGLSGIRSVLSPISPISK